MARTTRAPEPARLAKLTRPRPHAAFARERLFGKMDACGELPTVWIVGPPGAGKTTIASTWLERRGQPGLWYQIDRGDGDPATFFYYLQLAARGVRDARRAKLPLLTPEYLGDLYGFARRWFRELFAHLPSGATLTLDNYQEVPVESLLHRALAEACEEVPPGSQVIFISWAEPPAEFSRLAVAQQAGRIEWGDLRFSLDELRAMDRELDDATLATLHGMCDGWAAGFTLLLNRYRSTGLLKQVDQPGSMQNVFDYFMAQAFRDATPEQRETLIRCAFLPRFTAAMACEISGNPKAGELLEWLYRRHLFVVCNYGELPTYEFHSLFDTFLRAKAADFYAAQGLADLNARAAMMLERAGSHDEAVATYLKAGEWSAAAALILRLAPALVTAGRGQTIRQWVAALPQTLLEETPWATYWVGMALLSVNLDDAYDSFETAHRRFVANGDKTGQLLAAGGCIEAVAVKFEDLKQGLPWLSIIDPLLAAGENAPGSEAEAHLLGSILAYGNWAAPLHELNRRASERLSELLADPTAISKNLVAAFRLLGHFGLQGMVAQARQIAALIEVALQNPDLPAYLQPMWLHSLRWFVHHSGECQRALEIGEALEAIALDNKFGNARILFVASYTVRAEILLDRSDFAGALEMNECRRRALCWGDAKPVTVALVEARVAAARGDHDGARRCLAEALRDIEQRGFGLIGSPFNFTVVAIQLALGDNDSALRLVEDSLAQIGNRPVFVIQAGLELARAMIDARAGRHESSQRRLRTTLARMREAGIGAMPRTGIIGPWAFRVALENDIETSYVRRLISNMGVLPDTPDAPFWPWALKLTTLGSFAISIDGALLEFSGKAPRRLLELLQAIVGHGQGVGVDAVIGALWPDAEADAADTAFRVALSRLRKLLGRDDSILLNDGKLALNERLWWVDAWAIERLFGAIEARPDPQQLVRLLDLYRGPFLAQEREKAWMLPLRERLQLRFIGAAGRLGDLLEREGNGGAALELYYKVLEQNPIAEAIYRRLMRTHLALGQKTEALTAYRRCREMLSIVLGIKPGTDTEAVHRQIAG